MFNAVLRRFSSSIFAQPYTARVAGIRHAEAIAELDDGADDRVELHRTPRFVVLQHRRLVRPDLFRASHALLNGDRELDVQLRGDRFGLGHDFPDDVRHFGMPHQFFERAAGQRANRVEGDVAEQLHPDLRDGTCVVTGARRPAAISASASALTRSVRIPLGSPRLRRFPSV